MCGGGEKRVKSVFLSETSAVEIEIMPGGLIDTVPYFLLHYTVLYALGNIHTANDKRLALSWLGL